MGAGWSATDPRSARCHPNKAMARALEDAWLGRFYDQADIEAGKTFSRSERIVRLPLSAGEAFIRFVVTETGELRLRASAGPNRQQGRDDTATARASSRASSLTRLAARALLGPPRNGR